MIVRLKDPTNATVLLNTENVLYAGAALDGKTRAPMLGLTLVMFVGGHSCIVKGTPEEVYVALRKFDLPVRETANGGGLVQP